MKREIQKFLRKWIGKCGDALKKKDIRNHVFCRSIPIFWFGDLDQYSKSHIKIVTVGLNPSYKEFTEERFERSAIKSFYKRHMKVEQGYYKTLNGYFMLCPYEKWFANFEKVLRMFGSSYGGKMKGGLQFQNCALHIDLMSPFATYPTWGNLCDDMQKRFKDETKGLFKELILLLKPDLIIISCSEELIGSVFRGVSKIKATGVLSKYVYGFNWAPRAKCHSVKVICGRNMRGTPFGGFTIGKGKEIKKLMKKLGNVK